MKSFKILSILLTAALIVFLAGCSANPEESGNTAGSGDTASSESTTQTPSKYETLDNPNVTVVYWNTVEAYEDSKKLSPFTFDAVHDSISDFEKKYGGKVNFIGITWGKMLEKTMTLQNAGDPPDLFMVSDQTFYNVVTKGIIQPIDDYVDDQDFSFYIVGRDLFSYDGKTYGIPIKPYVPYIVYNKTMFEENGLKTPAEYYDEGNWTFDTFAECGKAFTRDTDNDGKINIWGFSSCGDIIKYFIVANGGCLYKYENGKFVSHLKDPKTIEALDYMADWLKQPGGFWNLALNQFEEFDNGRLAMDRSKEYPDPNLKFEMDLVLIPRGPSNTDGTTFVYPNGWSIPTGAKNPEGAVAFVYMMNKITKERGDAIDLKRFGQKKFDILNNPDLIPCYSLDMSISNVWEILTPLTEELTNQVPAVTVAEKYDKILQAALEKSYGTGK